MSKFPRPPVVPKPPMDAPVRVPIVEETVRSTVIVLADGAVLSVKPVVKSVERTGKAPNGDPIYSVSTAMNVTLDQRGST